MSRLWKQINWHGAPQDETEDRLEVAIIKRFMNWKKITVVGGTFCGLGQGGTVECWGSNLAGSLGRGIADADLRETTTVAPVVFDGIFTDLTGGLASVYGRTIDGELYGWGHNGAYGKLGQGTTQLEYTTPVSITLE